MVWVTLGWFWRSFSSWAGVRSLETCKQSNVTVHQWKGGDKASGRYRGKRVPIDREGFLTEGFTDHSRH